MKVEIFSTPTCHYCMLAKEFFKENDVSFEDHNVVENMEKRQEMLDKSGQMGVPVIIVGEEIVIGFDEDKLREILKI